jgi:hypothetical protein
VIIIFLVRDIHRSDRQRKKIILQSCSPALEQQLTDGQAVMRGTVWFGTSETKGDETAKIG